MPFREMAAELTGYTRSPGPTGWGGHLIQGANYPPPPPPPPNHHYPPLLSNPFTSPAVFFNRSNGKRARSGQTGDGDWFWGVVFRFLGLLKVIRRLLSMVFFHLWLKSTSLTHVSDRDDSLMRKREKGDIVKIYCKNMFGLKEKENWAPKKLFMLSFHVSCSLHF